MSSTAEKRKVEARALLEGLNPQQREAVARTMQNDALVIAGAGSGKTRVLTKRTAYLLKRGLKPSKILTVTFTNKAAAEMKERIASEVGADKAKKITVGTFHSLAVRWLRKWPAEAGLKKNWTIFDSDEQNKTMKTVLKNLNMPADKSSVRSYLGTISGLKNDMLTPEQYRNQINTSNERDNYKVYYEYQDALRRNNAVDFDDLIMKMVIVLETNTVVRKKLQNQFKYIMVDEYQDTNECQYRMIKHIRGKDNNLFVVGDDYQGIYGWRGADIDKILNFQNDYPSSKVIKLEENYRSKQTIVQAANQLMTNNTKQMDKTCFSSHEQGETIKHYIAPTDKDEAAFIAEEIVNLVKYEGYDYNDIAILYRTNVLSRMLEDQLITQHVPYNMVSGFSFYERKEIKDVMAWIQLSINPHNDVSCERVLGLLEGVGKTTISKLIDKARSTNKSLYECCKAYKPKQVKIQAGMFILEDTVNRLNTIYEVGKNVTDTPISDMFELVFKYTRYKEKLIEEASEESIRRADNIDELIRVATEYEADLPNPDIQDFLDQVSLTSQQDKTNDGNEINMMTLHASKGLEYPVVFIAGAEENILPHSNSSQDPASLEEERRLMYVGITRAKERVYLSSADRRMKWDRTFTFNSPSRFIDELPKHLVEEI